MSGTLVRAGAAVLLALLAAGLALWLSRRPVSDRLDWQGHFEDLRRRIIASGATILVFAALMLSFRWPAGSRYPRPSVTDNLAAQAFQALRDDLVPPDVRVVVVRPIDGFMAELSIALGLGLLLALPLVVWQIGGFFWPALREEEKRFMRQAFVPIMALFLAGAWFAYALVLPFLLDTLYDYGRALGAEPLLAVSDLITFTLGMMLVMGFAFQTPLVMYALSRVGLVPAPAWIKYWRHATVAIWIVAALVTDPTVASQAMVALPLMVLYVLGIGLAKVAEPKQLTSMDSP